jgi:hypothetical protein
LIAVEEKKEEEEVVIIRYIPVQGLTQEFLHKIMARHLLSKPSV